jgi:hypothetical protein
LSNFKAAAGVNLNNQIEMYNNDGTYVKEDQMVELLFALAFSLHNAEEAVWLPGWSKNAKSFHQPVTKNEFIFAVICIGNL